MLSRWIAALCASVIVCDCEAKHLGGPDFDASALWQNGACDPNRPLLPASQGGCASGDDEICQGWAEGVAIGKFGFSRCVVAHSGTGFCGDYDNGGGGCGNGPPCGYGEVCASDTSDGPRHCIDACNWHTADPDVGTNDGGFSDGFDASGACVGGSISFSGPCTPALDQFCRDWATARTVHRFGHSRCENVGNGAAATCSVGDLCPVGTASCRCTPTLVCPWGAVCYSDTPDGSTHCGLPCQP